MDSLLARRRSIASSTAARRVAALGVNPSSKMGFGVLSLESGANQRPFVSGLLGNAKPSRFGPVFSAAKAPPRLGGTQASSDDEVGADQSIREPARLGICDNGFKREEAEEHITDNIGIVAGAPSGGGNNSEPPTGAH